MNVEKNFVSAVVYTRNHGRFLETFLRGLVEIFNINFEKFEIICVNDYSVDDSIEVIKRFAKEIRGMSISIIQLSYSQGLESAMIAGVDAAIGDFVFEFDTPIVNYQFEEVINVYRQALKGYDVVSASPDVGERLASKAFYNLFRHYSKNDIQLNTEWFRVLSRRGINRINMLSTSIPYRKAIYFNCGLKAINVKYKPIDYARNQPGAHPPRKSERIELAINSLLLFTNVGSTVAFFMAALMFIVACFMVGYTSYVYFTFDHVVQGWTTTMLFISVSFAGLFALLAILIKYVSMILYLQHTKQTYVFESVEKL